jgi:hypothetical protein
LQPTFGGGTDAFLTEINPTGSALVYSTYLGGSGEDDGFGIFVDNSGNAYITGQTYSTDFPITPGTFQTACGDPGCTMGDAFVTKFGPSGSSVVYSSYLGGSGRDIGYSIAADSAGNAYITGQTYSTNFPVTPGVFQARSGGTSNAFVTELNSTGTGLVYSTYLGGSGGDGGGGVALDSAGNAYVSGYTFSTNFPTTPGAFQTTCCGAFVSKINPSGTALVYSTYLGGSGGDQGNAIAVDSAGNAYVTGFTYSKTFPVTLGAFQKTRQGVGGDAFVTEINPAGSALVYSSYLGGSRPACACGPYNLGSGIAVDSSGGIYVVGFTITTNFPTTRYALAPLLNGGYDAFIAKFMYTPTTTGLVSSVDPSASGKPVIFTATVSAPSGGTPTGKVSFQDGAKALATLALTGSTVSFTTSKLPVGSNSITAVYGGDSNFSSSTSRRLPGTPLKVSDSRMS